MQESESLDTLERDAQREGNAEQKAANADRAQPVAKVASQCERTVADEFTRYTPTLLRGG